MKCRKLNHRRASIATRCLAALLLLVLLVDASVARAQTTQTTPLGDVFDQFFRYTPKENRAVFEDLPGETVDPFTGTLRIVQEDLFLPGKAGLDLRILRTYSSKIWGRADLLDMEPLLAEKEQSILGYGWSLHMGRLKNPYASIPTIGCGGDLPVYEAPDGSSQVFYPVPGSQTTFVSREFWRLELNCAALGGAQGACVWSNAGVRHEFSSANVGWQGMIAVWPVNRIVDPIGNAISVAYVAAPSGPAIDTITDSYGRTVSFSYTPDPNGNAYRLASITANANTYHYNYTWYGGVAAPLGGVALPGVRPFLTEVKPPEGPSYHYDYAYTAPVAQNQYALKTMVYPSGGSVSYVYGPSYFFTGRDMLAFAVVTQRTVTTGAVSAPWTYSYNSPGAQCSLTNTCSTDPGTGAATNLHLTTVTRPDGLVDTYSIIGFGFVADEAIANKEYMYAVGLTVEHAVASRASVQGSLWGPSPAISNVPFNAPTYSGNCGVYMVWDNVVRVPLKVVDVVWVDGARYQTQYLQYDSYGQPLQVVETGDQGGFGAPVRESRSTTWAYFAAPTDGSGATLNMVRGKPLSKSECVGTDCVNDAWTYSGPGYLRDSETKSGVATRYDYHPDGTLQRVTNAMGDEVTLSIYQYGVPTSIDFNHAFTIVRNVSWEGWITGETNGRGYPTSYGYDGLGRLTSVTPPGNNNATGYTYDPSGTWVRLARGAYFKNTYLDGLGRVTGTEDSENVQTSAYYDAMGRKWFESYPFDATTGEAGRKLEYDGLGRVTVETKAYRPSTHACDSFGSCRVLTTYFGNCVGTTVERGPDVVSPTTGRCYTSFGDPGERRLGQVSDAMGSLWQYAYDAYGGLTGVTAPLDQGKRTYHYDGNRYLHSQTTSEGGTVTFGRNAIGQMTSRTDARQVTATYDYTDPLRRLRHVTYSGGSNDDISRDYDNESNVVELDSVNGGTYTYGYDELNRMKSQTWSYPGGGSPLTTTYAYDAAGCLKSVTYPTGTVLSMDCDTANRVIAIRMGGATIVSNVVYHPSGQPTSVTYGNGLITAVHYDDRARVTTTGAPNVVNLKYGYDGADNVTSLDNLLDSTFSRRMDYDALDRLSTSTSDARWGTLSYYYDELGNRTAKLGSALFSAYTYDSTTNRLNASSGNEFFKPMTFVWDLAGRLASSSDGARYLYDGNNRRVQKVEPALTTVFHYDAAGRVIAETLPDGTKLRDYVYLGNRLVVVDGCMDAATYSSCTDRQWYHTDALGSPVARTGGSGNVVARLDYQAWGEQWQPALSGISGDRQYNGRLYDQGTGFHDYGARLYWPQIGRFVSADSYLGDPANPASLNRYSYVKNNPYRYTDPTGHAAADPCGGGGLGGGCGGGGGGAGSAGYPSEAAPGGGGGFRPPPIAAQEAAAGEVAAAEAAAAEAAAARAPAQRLLTQRAGPTGRISPSEVEGRTPQEIDARARQLGLEPKGPNPQGGKGSYVDPQTGKQRVLVHPEDTPPHGHVNNPAGERVGPDGTVVPKDSAEAHLPIQMMPSH